ncbi:MAG TPA: phosphoglucosamine mutase [Candidatus Dormibacteraeota bacterium]|nr:phosphoglucosamine mutase [Candidatus Dormibacteraeota bacterium]
MSEGRKLFGTNGVRGIVNKEMTSELALRLAQATGTYFHAADVTVGCDGRVSSPLFLDIVSAGLASVGCQVWNLGMITTPGLQFLTKDWGLKGGVMITASHNPPEYNGLKIMGNHGVELPHEEELKIECLFFKSKYRLVAWDRIKQPLPVPEKFASYIKSILENVGEVSRNRSLKVLVDSANAVSVLSTPAIIEKLGGNVSLVNGEIDGRFPSRLPEPTPEHLQETSKIMKGLHLDFGVAHDGDGDRAVFLDEHGEVCWGDHTFALVVRDFLQSHPGQKIVTPISSSQIIEEIVEKHGGEVVYTPVGSVYVSNLMLKINAKLGGEENGGIFYSPHVAARDGGITTAWIYKILSETRKTLSKLVAQLPKSYIVKDRIPCPNSIKDEVTIAIRNLPHKGKALEIDGIKLWIPPHSWILIRPSGTEPIFRILAEAPTKGKALRIVNDYKTKLSRIIKDRNRNA